MDGALLVGGSHTTPWWNGKLKTNYLKKASPAITRFVPGREGLGLTDRIDSVVDFMKQKNILVFDQNYGLWYDRRRDDHERIRRRDGDVWGPFYEQPFGRSGQGTAWEGLSKYDLKRPNAWYWSRLNDAFGTAHRAHASTALIAKYFDKDNKMFGYLMEKEVKAVDKVLNDIQRPFTAIMGGSKVSSKIEIIENLLNKVDNLIIAGGMTYTFTKAMGGKIGISICEDDKLDLALDLVKKAKEKGVNLVLAVDAKIADSFSNDANTKFCPVDEIPDGWEGLDIGPETEKIFADVIKNSKTILWNGPTGVFEFENFTHGSRAVGEAIVEATKNGAFSLVGGGDSVACVNKFGLASGVSYVSTGGGALLD